MYFKCNCTRMPCGSWEGGTQHTPLDDNCRRVLFGLLPDDVLSAAEAGFSAAGREDQILARFPCLQAEFGATKSRPARASELGAFLQAAAHVRRA